MERIEALKHVLQDGGYSEAEKTSALEALRDISANAQTAFERETAQAVLKELDGPAKDEPLDANMIRLLQLTGMTVEEWKAVSER